MAKKMKVYELAREMNIKSKEIISQAAELGIDVKSHMSTLSDDDIVRIKKGRKKTEVEAAPAVNKESESIINDIISGGNKKAQSDTQRRIPIGRPIVNKRYLAERERREEEEMTEDVPPLKSAETVKDTAESKADKRVEKEEKAEVKLGKKAEKEEKVEAKLEKMIVKESKTEEKAEKKKDKDEKAEAKIENKIENLEAKIEKKRDEGKVGNKIEKGNKKKEKAVEKVEKKDTKPESERKKESDKKVKEVNEKLKRKKKTSSKQAEAVRPVRQEKSQKAEKDSYGPHEPSDISDMAPRVKIISRAADREKEAEKKRPIEKKKTVRKANERRREERPSGERDNRKKASKKSDFSEDMDRTEGRKERRRGHKKDKHNKYEKLEQKSLEKQTRNKHSQYKVKTRIEEEEPEEVLPEGTVIMTVPITVAGFSEQTEISVSKVIMTLMKMGIMANINQSLDEDTVMILADELDIKVHIDEVEEEAEEKGLETFKDKEEDLESRPPIITVMGHVDHGKTSLLDAIRKTAVTARESGGITQHIGASEVETNGKKIVFLDTPGHEAFTAMRARGAHVTDIAVLVVAADDGVMPQTIESINHAKAANVPIIVAINKMDKPAANPDRVKKELADQGLLVEDWGGDVISVPVSAKSGEGIPELLEMILLQAEMLELKANPNRLAMGSVIEARLDKAKGPVATLLIMNGSLETGMSLVAGTCAGRIRLMTDFKGEVIEKAGPASAVEILGLSDVPEAGDEFNAVKEDRIAREIASSRQEKLREEVLARNSNMSLESLFSKIEEGKTKDLNIIIKGDVQGSIGALVSSLEKLSNDKVKVNIMHTGVGTVSESDIMLAQTSDAVIIGFNVRPSSAIQAIADRDGIEIRTYRVIYDVIDDVEAAMKGMLEPEYKEELLGKVEVRETFKVPGGTVAGAYVIEGRVVRNAEVRLVRDGIVVHEGKISSLRRFKDDAKEVSQGYECGIGIENYNDINVGDIIECYHMVEVEPSA
jgi:translation initiation factor IF-2